MFKNREDVLRLSDLDKEKAQTRVIRPMSRRALALAVTLQVVQVAIRAPPGYTTFGSTRVFKTALNTQYTLLHSRVFQVLSSR